MFIVESGVIVAAGMLFTFTKMSWGQRTWMLSHPLLMDVFIFILLNMLHWGTFSGVMVAATGALVCSGLITAGRYLYGYTDKSGQYVPGKFYVPKVQ